MASLGLRSPERSGRDDHPESRIWGWKLGEELYMEMGVVADTVGAPISYLWSLTFVELAGLNSNGPRVLLVAHICSPCVQAR